MEGGRERERGKRAGEKRRSKLSVAPSLQEGQRVLAVHPLFRLPAAGRVSSLLLHAPLRSSGASAVVEFEDRDLGTLLVMVGEASLRLCMVMVLGV